MGYIVKEIVVDNERDIKKELIAFERWASNDPGRDSFRGNLKKLSLMYNSYENALDAVESLDASSCYAAQFKDRSKVKPTKKFIALKERYDKAKERCKRVEEEVDIHNRKSKTITCDVCGKKYELAKIEGNHCPKCNRSLMSQTNRERLKNAQVAVIRAQRLYNEEYKKYMAKIPVKWLIYAQYRN